LLSRGFDGIYDGILEADGIGDGTFPLPVNLGSNNVAWHREEIENWRKSRPRVTIRQAPWRPAEGFPAPAKNLLGQAKS